MIALGTDNISEYSPTTKSLYLNIVIDYEFIKVDKEKAILNAGNGGSHSLQRELPPIPNEATKSEVKYTAEVTVSCSGVCVYFDSAWEPEFGDAYSDGKVQELRFQLLRQQNDVNKVEKALRNLQLPEGISQGKQCQQLLEKVKRYLFDSPGISFTPRNFKAWKRLVSGRGTVADAQFVIHEMAEIMELQRIQKETDFDFMGTDWEKMSRRQKVQWESNFDCYYRTAHSQALKYEYDFLAKQVFDSTNGKISLSAIVAAAIDPSRNEARLHMLVDEVHMEEHHDFESWRQRASEMVELNRRQLEKLGLHDSPTLEALVQAVKRQKLR